MPIKKAKISIKRTRGRPKFIVIAKRSDGATRILGGFQSKSEAQTKVKRLKKTGLVK